MSDPLDDEFSTDDIRYTLSQVGPVTISADGRFSWTPMRYIFVPLGQTIEWSETNDPKSWTIDV